jgi:pre-mRNA-splicing factor CWC22
MLCCAVLCCAAAVWLQVGAHLQEVAPSGLHSVFERFRAILHEGAIDKRCQYMIEGLFAVRKVGGGLAGWLYCF